jgi:hypothetical protein
MANKFPAVASLADMVLCMHATSCASERNWSTWGWTYAPRRNRLEVSTAEKLIYVQRNTTEPLQGVEMGHDDLLDLLGAQNESDGIALQ